MLINLKCFLCLILSKIVHSSEFTPSTYKVIAVLASKSLFFRHFIHLMYFKSRLWFKNRLLRKARPLIPFPRGVFWIPRLTKWASPLKIPHLWAIIHWWEQTLSNILYWNMLRHRWFVPPFITGLKSIRIILIAQCVIELFGACEGLSSLLRLCCI